MSIPGPLISNRVAGKRGACDRCRGQKLRCKREDQRPPQATCIRCFKAGATCSYSIAKPPGRNPASKTCSLRKRRENGGGSADFGSKASMPTVNASGQSGFIGNEAGTGRDWSGTGTRGSSRLLEEYTADQECEGETEDPSPIQALTPLSLDDSSNGLSGVHLDFPACPSSSTATLPWPHETIPSFSNNDAEASCLESSGFKYSWGFQDHRAQPMDTQVPTVALDSSSEQLGDVAVDAYGMYAQACSTNVQIPETSDEAMDVDLLTASAHTASFNLANAMDARPRRAQDSDRGSVRLPGSSGMSSTPTLSRDSAKTEAGIKLGKECLSINESQHRRMQELSQLAMDLYAQLATNEPENHQPTPGGATATTLQDHFVGSVLKSSDTFLALLDSFPKATTPTTTFHSSPPTPSTNHGNPTYDFSGSGASPSAPALNIGEYATNGQMQHFHGKLPINSSDDSQPPPPLNIATVLQLLTCYIHIIHLHSILHARILDYIFSFIQHNPEHVDMAAPIFPDMQVGGVSLNRFGTFQVELLLRISVHMLGEIESAMGLPKEFRVEKGREGRTGVLGPSVSADFVKCLMTEKACREKAESVREQLENLRRVLKRVIAW